MTDTPVTLYAWVPNKQCLDMKYCVMDQVGRSWVTVNVPIHYQVCVLYFHCCHIRDFRLTGTDTLSGGWYRYEKVTEGPIYDAVQRNAWRFVSPFEKIEWSHKDDDQWAIAELKIQVR